MRRVTWGRSIACGLVALFVCVGGPARAQFFSGGVYGAITGPDGKPLAAVTVSLNGPTKTRAVVTTLEGQFRFLGLDPGNYQMRAEAPGFEPATYPSIAVVPGRNTAVQVRMSPRPNETITVTAEPPRFDGGKFTPVLTVNRSEMQTIPTPRDPWAIAMLAPGVLASEVNSGGSASGQQPLLVAPGANSEQNAFVFDGVVITDLAATGASPTYFDIDQFDEVHVAAGSGDPSLATAGVTIDMVTRRSTNAWRGSARGFATNDASGGAARAKSNAVRSVVEAGAEGGGELWPERAWLWSAGSLSHILRQAYGGAPVDIRLDNETVKANFQLGLAHSAVALANRSGKIWDGRGAGPTRSRETLTRQKGDVALFKIEDTAIVGAHWTLTAFVSAFDGSYSALPFAGRDPEPVIGPDNVTRGGWISSWSSRDGRQWRLFGSTARDGKRADHEISFGAGQREFRESSALQSGARNLYFIAGPVVGESDDVAQALRFGRTGTDLLLDETWLQDSIRLGSTTIGVGLRLDRQSGSVPATHYDANPAFPEVLPALDVPKLGPQFRWRSLAPRLGVVHEFGRDGRTVLGASYSRFASQLGTATVSRMASGYAYAYVLFKDGNGDHVYQSGEPYQVSGIWAGDGNAVDPHLRAPVTDALALSLEQRLGRDWRLRVDASRRSVRDLFDSRQLVVDGAGTTRLATRDDYVLDRVVGGKLPDGSPFAKPVYALGAGLKPVGRVLVNGDRRQEYRGLTLTVDRPYRDGWMLRANATLGDFRWHLGSRFRLYDDPTDAALGPAIDVADPADTDGEIVAQQADAGERKDVFLNSGWSFGVAGSVEVARGKPWSFLVATHLSGRQGYPIPYAVRVFGSDGQMRWVQADRRGDEFRSPDLYTVDLRLEKDFQRREMKIAASLEAFNLLDNRVALQRSRQVNSTVANRVLETMSPRVFRAGVRISFR